MPLWAFKIVMSCWILDQFPGDSLPRIEPSCFACSRVTVRAPLTIECAAGQKGTVATRREQSARTHGRVVFVVAADPVSGQTRDLLLSDKSTAYLYSSGLVSFKVEYMPEVSL